MTALAQERVTQRMDGSGQAAGPDKINLAIAANQVGWQGGIACVNAAGRGVNASATAGLICAGVWSKSFNATGLADGALNVNVEQGVFPFTSGTGVDAITQANAGQICFVMDDQTVGLTSGGGARSIAGVIVQVDTFGVWVEMGVCNSAALSAGFNSPAALPQRTIGNVRQVRLATAAALAAYTAAAGVLTANANGALANIDGVAAAVGDRVLLTAGAAGADNGIYVVTSLGGAGSKWVLTRASDYPSGGVVYGGLQVSVNEGTLFGNTTWFLKTTGASTIDTTATDWYPRAVTQSVTLVGGTATLTNVPILSATKSGFAIVRTTANTSTATTGGYHPVGAITPGAIGTASVTIDATVAAGTINNADVSTLAVTIING